MTIGGPPDWRRLFTVATGLINHVNRSYPVIDEWSFGGGTAMMLQLDHRDSHDVDIFLPDAQVLRYLDPAKAELAFDVVPDGYQGDGVKFQKFAFNGIGEIDFIVAQALTSVPHLRTSVEGVSTRLETVAEIVAKKVYYRGASIRPRDIFDIAAAAQSHERELIEALRYYRPHVAATLSAIAGLNADFVSAAIAPLMIRPTFQHIAATAIERTITVLKRV
ncbi:nucleotidyl transferase AbiEii/AbiGii toxin family protein [Rhizobium metallidurans]